MKRNPGRRTIFDAVHMDVIKILFYNLKNFDQKFIQSN